MRETEVKNIAACTFAASMLLSSAAWAETIKWARVDDALSLDPHATNQAITAGFLHHIYETLVDTDDKGNIVPRLALSWELKAGNPNTWVFKLRPGVKFHDGSDFTAEDAAFSINRARSKSSQMKSMHTAVVDAKAVDDLTLEVTLSAPNAIYPNHLTNTFMMDKGWSEKHNVVDVQDFNAGSENYAVRNGSGTGMYILESRDVGVRSILKLNENHWSKKTPDVTRIEYITIADPATRTAALISGEVDLILDVPVQDIGRLSNSPGIRVETGPENRVIYLQYRVAGNLVNAGAGKPSPFADVRVREAAELAIDRDAIKQVIMRGQSIPTDIIAPPFVNGFSEDLAAYPKANIQRAKQLMAEAGFADGFEITLDTPNNRYIADEAISQAVVGMLGRIGIKVQLQSRPISQHSPTVLGGKSDFWLLGWGMPTFDSAYAFSGMMHTKKDSYGVYNSGGYSSPKMDELVRAMESELDIKKRNAMIRQAWELFKTERPAIALHNQVLAYGMKNGVKMKTHPGDMPRMYEVTLQK
jgi:peptide/nickel transport system substrate-binding protein